MKILALDTATANCSAALLFEGGLLVRERLLERGHAASILAMIDEVLAEGGVSLGQLTAIAFGRGPGSFTGVRLAASVTQGLAFAAGLPVLPVSDLRAVAQRVVAQEAAAGRILVCNDARMHEVYWSAFSRSAAGLAEPVGAEHVGGPARVALPAEWLQGPAVWGAGTGFDAYPELGQLGPRGLSVIRGLYPRATEIAHLALAEAQAGRLLDSEMAVPVYLRDNVVQPPAGSH